MGQCHILAIFLMFQGNGSLDGVLYGFYWAAPRLKERREILRITACFTFTFLDLGFSFYWEWKRRLLLETAMLKKVILIVWEFCFHIYYVKWGSVPWSSDLLFGDSTALMMAGLCSTQAVFRLHLQRDAYSVCWSHPLTETLTVPIGWLCDTDRTKFSPLI